MADGHQLSWEVVGAGPGVESGIVRQAEATSRCREPRAGSHRLEPQAGSRELCPGKKHGAVTLPILSYSSYFLNALKDYGWRYGLIFTQSRRGRPAAE